VSGSAPETVETGFDGGHASALTAAEAYQEVFAREGVPYFVSATESACGYRGGWLCEACGVRGEVIGDATTREAAIVLAKSSLFDHHADFHLSGQRSLVNEILRRTH
jgi:hypothetical protein